MNAKHVLLVEPAFPYPNKSKNKANSIHKNFVPIGLLKLGAMYRDKGCKTIKLVRGNKSEAEIGFIPNEILITTLFTYWSKYVWECVAHYRKLFPTCKIQLGGIYATLHAKTEKFQKLLKEYDIINHIGTHDEAEKYYPDYSLIPEIDYHATHMMRGCIRRCSFCGTWKIEPKIVNKTKEQIIKELQEVGKNKVIFYDNNILANRYIKDILKELSSLKINGQRVSFESQSGYDGRLIELDPELSVLIKKAGFDNIRIAWDNGLSDRKSIKKQISHLVNAGYSPKDVSVFMIYNFDMPYNDMIKKLNYCKKLGVQITDCRYRPLEVDHDDYNPHLRNGQPEGSFYIHKKSGWTDKKIRKFRHNVREHNIWIRYAKDKGLKYDNKMEKWSAINNAYKFFKLGKAPQMELIERSPLVMARCKALSSIRNFILKNKINPPDLSQYSHKDLDLFIKTFQDERSKS